MYCVLYVEYCTVYVRTYTIIIEVSFNGQNFCSFHGLKHNCESFTTKQAPQGYLVVQIQVPFY